MKMQNITVTLRYFISRLALIVLVSSVFFHTSHAEEVSKYKLGVVLALTGPVAVHGVPIKNAILLGKKDFDKENKLELIFEDDGFQASQSVTAVNKLINFDKIDGLLLYGTNQGLATVGLAEKAGIPFFSFNVNRSVVHDRKNAFLFLPSIESMMIPLIKESKKRNYQKVFLVSTLQDSCLLQADIFRRNSGIDIVGSEEVLPGETNFRVLATKIKGYRPSAVFMSTLIPQAALLSKKLREIGYKGDFLAGMQESSYSELALSNNALLGAFVVSGNELGVSAFSQRYKIAYGADVQ